MTISNVNLLIVIYFYIIPEITVPSVSLYKKAKNMKNIKEL
ncbi:hypothetical protein CBB_0439 [Clostridium botulinum Bf]|uniref:Uncharacterized protein n=1 Tax=Clostridium botulinum (strain 657 / Type Ba4) TaxID=515621 RepID=A0A3F3AC27_CLOB6|nr:hypothetical protein CLJ_B0474 [Clostridium botulinum Ba4 str. 657]EDT87474.1 hypothetical protein CBB_0439 [Clostridium botulinum Bf]